MYVVYDVSYATYINGPCNGKASRKEMGTNGESRAAIGKFYSFKGPMAFWLLCQFVKDVG
jgi:hypothetical protein